MTQTLLKALRVLIPALDLRGLDLPGARSRGVGAVKVERQRRGVRALVAHVDVDCKGGGQHCRRQRSKRRFIKMGASRLTVLPGVLPADDRDRLSGVAALGP